MNDGEIDIAVAGAGMVGACAAYALAQNGYRVALIEASPEPAEAAPDTGDYDLRVSAISPRSRHILDALGVWRRIVPSRICYYEQMSIWHQHGSARVEFDAVDLARDNLGAIVENRLIQNALQQACREQQRIHWHRPDRVVELIDDDDSAVTLRLESGTVLRAQLLLAADGRHSPTRRLAGIRVRGASYGQTALIANVDTELPHAHTAWQRFLATGPLAFLPLANGQSSIVWSCDDTFAAEVAALDDAAFCDALGEAFEYRLGAVTGCSPRQQLPLAWQLCDDWLMRRVLLVGDAAHAVHPLAGQGVNLGFSDVELLARLLNDARRPVGLRSLRRYARQRKSETWLAGQGFSALKWFFGQTGQPLVGLRDLGMRTVENTPWCKRVLMQKAVQNIT